MVEIYRAATVKLFLYSLILLISVVQNVASKTIDFTNLKQNIVNTYDFDTLMSSYTGVGSTVRFFTYTNIIDLFTAISTQFPDISRLSKIGKSFEGRDMILLTLGANITGNEGTGKTLNPSMLLTSAHHAKEVIGVTMNVYTTLSIIHGYYHPPANTNQSAWNQTSANSWYHNNIVYKNLLTNHNVYVLPLVNIDGYYMLSSYYDSQGIFEMVSKNRRTDANWENLDVGVDLNRNYAVKWGLDNNGSSANSWDQDYRGASSFSELETQAVRDFITSTDKNIKIAINFNAFGNLFIIPNNFDDQWNKQMVNSTIYALYEDIRSNGNLPLGMLFGNTMQTVHFPANGEATDWMSTQNGMIAMSPELGIHDSSTDKFFPDQKYVQPIMEANYKWIFYTTMKLSSQLELKINRFTRIPCVEVCTEADTHYQRFYIELQLKNLGFSSATNIEIRFTETPPFKIVIIDGTEKGIVSGYANIIKLDLLKSMDTYIWELEGRIANSDWEALIAGTVMNTENYVSFSFAQYPSLNADQTASVSFNQMSLFSTETADYSAGGPSGETYKYFLIAGGKHS